MSQVWTQHFLVCNFFFSFFSDITNTGESESRPDRQEVTENNFKCNAFYSMDRGRFMKSNLASESSTCLVFFFFNGAWEYLYSIGNGEKKTNTPSLFAKASGLGNNYSHIFF